MHEIHELVNRKGKDGLYCKNCCKRANVKTFKIPNDKIYGYYFWCDQDEFLNYIFDCDNSIVSPPRSFKKSYKPENHI